MIPESKWEHKGLAGHFICASQCLFRLHTVVGGYKISTVGAMYTENSKDMQEIGISRHYETMVFKRDEQGNFGNYSEVDFEGLKKLKKQDPYEVDKKGERVKGLGSRYVDFTPRVGEKVLLNKLYQVVDVVYDLEMPNNEAHIELIKLEDK